MHSVGDNTSYSLRTTLLATSPKENYLDVCFGMGLLASISCGTPWYAGRLGEPNDANISAGDCIILARDVCFPDPSTSTAGYSLGLSWYMSVRGAWFMSLLLLLRRLMNSHASSNAMMAAQTQPTATPILPSVDSPELFDADAVADDDAVAVDSAAVVAAVGVDAEVVDCTSR